MTLSIPLLRRDHVHFSLILDMLDRQADALAEGNRKAVPLILLGLKYFRNYPRKVHHPKEDMIYGMLRHHMERGIENIFAALEEHADLDQELATIWASAQSLENKNAAATQTFCDSLHKFTARERHHMEREEAHLYPAAVHMLTTAEWASIAAYCESDRDPVFGEETASAFDRILADILIRGFTTHNAVDRL